LRTGKISRGNRQLDIIGEGATLLIAGIHHSGKPYVDLIPDVNGAELPLHWIEFLQRELPLHTAYTVLRTICAPVQQGKSFISKDEADADPVSLACFYRLWELKHQTTDFPTLGQAVPCWLHPPDRHPSGGFYINPNDGHVRFRCFHEAKSWALAELYARIFCGVGPTVILSKALLALFDARMQIACGVIERPTVPYIPLPDNAPELEQCLYAGYLDAVACKWVRHPGESTTFSRDFARVWCGLPVSVSDRAFGASWHRLCDQGFVLTVETIYLGGRDTKRYLPFPPSMNVEA
jgi:hypothetical protein